MGGKALSFQTKRLPAEEYQQLVSEVVCLFRSCIHGKFSEIIPVKAYRQKESFGDADFVVQYIFDRSDVESFIRRYLNATEIVKNGGCWSFDYKDFQCDFVFSSSPTYTADWMAWNDLSNLVGRCAHKMGLKFGHDGLWLPIRDGDQKIDEILLSVNYTDCLTFLGFDANRWLQGFDTLEDIYEFIANGLYFNPDIYLLDNRNAKARMRDSKRPTYMGFLKWCEESKERFHESYQFDPDKSVYLDTILDHFKVRRIYGKIMADHEEAKFIASKFNGRLVMEHTPLTGKELGNFMVHLKNFMNEEFVRNAPQCVIISAIKGAYDDYSQSNRQVQTNDQP